MNTSYFTLRTLQVLYDVAGVLGLLLIVTAAACATLCGCFPSAILAAVIIQQLFKVFISFRKQLDTSVESARQAQQQEPRP